MTLLFGPTLLSKYSPTSPENSGLVELYFDRSVGPKGKVTTFIKVQKNKSRESWFHFATDLIQIRCVTAENGAFEVDN